jgi:hypothetical protein
MLWPGTEDRTHCSQHGGKVSRLLLEQHADMRAGRSAGAASSRDVRDLSQGQSKSPGAPDECQQLENVALIDAVAGRGALCRRNDSAALVQANRLRCKAALLGHVTDEEPICHDKRKDLAS